jgi:hypothetical protein
MPARKSSVEDQNAASSHIDDLLNGIPGADENTVESTVQVSGGQSIVPPEPLDGDLDDDLLDGIPPTVDESADDTLGEDDKAPQVPTNSVLIHFVADGFSALEQIWYTGQELEIPIGSRWWEATLDRDGESWMLIDEESQIAKWGKVFFRPGEWPGEPFGDARAQERERQRARRPTHPNPGSLFPSRGR